MGRREEGPGIVMVTSMMVIVTKTRGNSHPTPGEEGGANLVIEDRENGTTRS